MIKLKRKIKFFSASVLIVFLAIIYCRSHYRKPYGLSPIIYHNVPEPINAVVNTSPKKTKQSSTVQPTKVISVEINIQDEYDSELEAISIKYIDKCKALKEVGLNTERYVDELKKIVELGDQGLSEKFQKMLIRRKERYEEDMEYTMTELEKKHVDGDIIQFCQMRFTEVVDIIEMAENQGLIEDEKLKWNEDVEIDGFPSVMLADCIGYSVNFETSLSMKVYAFYLAIANQKSAEAEKIKKELLLVIQSKPFWLRHKEKIQQIPELVEKAGDDVIKFCTEQIDKRIEIIDSLEEQGILE